MRTIFLTGATGYLGAYTASRLLAADPSLRLLALVRASTEGDARARLWRALQLHLDADAFRAVLPRVTILPGDLHAPDLGLDTATWARVAATADTVLHLAGAAERHSAADCDNTNLRGTLAVLRLARAADADHGLARYGYLSSVAVTGPHPHAVVREDAALDWRSEAETTPDARTKRFAEHMARELLPNVPRAFFRPSIVMGDSRFPETTQLAMVRAFCALADLPLLPLPPDARLDIVNADWAADVIAQVTLAPTPPREVYHLAAGTGALTTAEIARAMTPSGRRPTRFARPLLGPFRAAVDLATGPKRPAATPPITTLLKRYLPDITSDTVFDNTHAVAAVGRRPTPFDAYCAPLYRWAKEVGFSYPHAPLPPEAP